MNILITAGGTSEKIDEVRHLANQATGRLGKEIATSLKEESVNLFYVHGPQAVLPTLENGTFYPIHSVRDLLHTMEKILTTESIDYVIHSMAVSDYELALATNEEALANRLAQEIIQLNAPNKEDIETTIKRVLTDRSLFQEPTQKKISSQSEQLILLLEKAPKVISHIKKWQPETTLIGFKLLVDVTEEHLVSVAKESSVKNEADYILANDLSLIHGDQHTGLLVSENGIEARFSTKQEIAQGIKQIMIKE